MPDYSKGYVYMLKNTTTGLIYIGASCDTLHTRYNGRRSPGSRRCTSWRLFESGGDVTIEVLDYCPCETRNELLAQEDHYVRLFKEGCGDMCVNKARPVRSKQEVIEYKAQWYKDNIDKIVAKGIEYRESNKERIWAQQKAWRKANGKANYQANKERKQAQSKAWKDKQPMVDCPCGGHYNKAREPKHLKTKLHQSYIQATP